jgi:hypothetical protein
MDDNSNCSCIGGCACVDSLNNIRCGRIKEKYGSDKLPVPVRQKLWLLTKLTATLKIYREIAATLNATASKQSALNGLSCC